MEKWLGLPLVDQYNGLDLYNLPINHAYVLVNTTVDNVGIYAIGDDCFNCPYKLVKYLKAGEESSWMVDTSVRQSWRIMKSEYFEQVARNVRKGLLCQMRPVLHEYGVYRLGIGSCEVKAEVQPTNSYIHLLLCSAILLVLAGIYGALKYCTRKKKNKQEKVFHVNEENTESINNLDMFRNVLMYALIFTTTGGGGYPIFKTVWGGLTVADCLYFAYIWTIGFNIPTLMEDAFNKRSKCAIVRDIFKRSFSLIFLGVAIESSVEHNPEDVMRLWCPLQRMGVAYFVAACAYALTVQKIDMKSKKIICKAMSNLVSLMWCWILSGFLLAIIIILISTFISFNCLANTSLSGLPDYSSIFSEVTLNCNNETSEFANKIFVAESKKMVDVNAYLGFSRGIMGIVSTVMYSIIGLKAGFVFVHYPSSSDRLKLWGFWATLFGLGGVIFAGVSHPFYFNIWPISSIIVITTATLYAFAFHYILMDLFKWTTTEGQKSPSTLLVFCGHLLFSNSIPFRWKILLDNHFIYVLQCYWIVSLWALIGWFLKGKVKIQI